MPKKKPAPKTGKGKEKMFPKRKTFGRKGDK